MVKLENLKFTNFQLQKKLKIGTLNISNFPILPENWKIVGILIFPKMEISNLPIFQFSNFTLKLENWMIGKLEHKIIMLFNNARISNFPIFQIFGKF